MTPDDDADFEPWDGEEADVEELRASLLRLRAQLDQTEAAVAAQRAEMAELRAMVDRLAADIRAFEARARRRRALFAWAERCFWFVIGLYVATLLGLI